MSPYPIVIGMDLFIYKMSRENNSNYFLLKMFIFSQTSMSARIHQVVETVY